jgi:hypothetical protein
MGEIGGRGWLTGDFLELCVKCITHHRAYTLVSQDVETCFFWVEQ